MRLLTLAYLFAAGIFLMWVPWTDHWDLNWFVQASPRVLAGPFTRALVALFGAFHLLLGMADLYLRKQNGDEAES
jgi:hypothetical protein